MPDSNIPQKDVSMTDFEDAIASNTNSITQSLSQMNIDGPNELEPQTLTKHKSTLIFDDDDEIPPYSNHEEHANDLVSDSGDENDSTSHLQNGSHQNSTIVSQPQQQQQQQQNHQPAQQQPAGQPSSQPQQRNTVMVPVDITWQQGGEKVYVTGSFTGWRKMIGLVPVPGQPGVLHVKLQLPPGTHKFRFIVDNELRFSDFLPTATDQMGNFVNYLEAVAPPQTWTDEQQQQEQPQDLQTQQLLNQQQVQHAQQPQVQQPQVKESQVANDNQQDITRPESTTNKKSKKMPTSARSRIAFEIEQEPDDMGDGFTRFREEKPLKPQLEYTQDIPAVFTDPTVMEQYYLTLDQQQNNHQNLSWLTPPQLPPHLENVILNSYSSNSPETGQNNSGSLPIPNHVVLNHLATSSIKHNTLCVASIVRYKRKYVTQILYAPLQ
ncbi:hypothetical protein Kpol_195p2 [Vanderwaltozyma polyspora DSM 70294]|uniref:Association with the SNF1 complex (ASC) domain-containing protein n=1 Tax=Vanderwaltozyma polyspora (strain ATCC 22028 / DSM 70294 / BCRC 21397 / CBS 2163 / NBRC 10782 / NRRL Y-8283 / UCD 57-17) TaxID=436907 RepID=A7TTP9_VANPO|nr:uncharacterized protein Kpol_195p2 [Vanderwaltozyma polyspora DSM 70294]EDO14358.1 hypothetical protein Kpol_195p2 [Vanderwaltozyma polyspora DSM 70294]